VGNQLGWVAILLLLGWIASKGIGASRDVFPPTGLRRLRDRVSARHNGKRDGQAGIPTPTAAAYPPALIQIKERAEEDCAKLARLWANEDANVGRRVGTTTRNYCRRRKISTRQMPV
jgi:hypothetical protein